MGLRPERERDKGCDRCEGEAKRERQVTWVEIGV